MKANNPKGRNSADSNPERDRLPAQTSQGARPEPRTGAFRDSELPPPPQLRRARSTSDPARSPRDRNTGIKNRDASGAKHEPRPRQNKGRAASSH